MEHTTRIKRLQREIEDCIGNERIMRLNGFTSEAKAYRKQADDKAAELRELKRREQAQA